ncbi:S1 family peptidase [Brucella anthropi]|uniref:S1 family peptidase n=1 Tax=Brucella anthropi TaxID=529 RepID=UPI00384CCA5E
MRFCKIVVAVTVAALLALAYWQPFAEEIRAESVAKIFDDKGHGSAVYIGNGYFISASHVVGQAPVVNLLLTDGRQIKGDVLWSNTGYDIALIKSGPLRNVEASRLSCTVPAVGDPIYAKGNPSNMDFITVYGRIAGKERSAGLWKSVVITDIATVPGQSGGPVFDQHGRVIGITVGVMLAPSGFTRSIVGIGYVVPGQAICGLMARV